MRVFIAGGTGVIGSRVARLLAQAGHDVAATSRDPGRAAALEELGATGVVTNVLDEASIRDAISEFGPDVVMHQVTDLPSAQAMVPLRLRRLNRVRTLGTDHLLEAASAAGARVIAQSVAFPLPGVAQRAIDHLEKHVLAADGLVVRYGAFYGEGTWKATAPKGERVVHIDTAAQHTVELLDAPAGVVEVLDSGVRRIDDPSAA